MKYEVLDASGNVINTIIADPEFMQVNYPGGNYREVIEPGIEKNPIITKFEFLKRFTSDERKAINSAAKINPDVEDFKLLLEAAQEVDLSHQDTVTGVNSLESVGLLAPGRASEILNNQAA